MEEQRCEWSISERKVMGAVENDLENCADIKKDIDALARSIEPEDEGVCLRYILKHSTRAGSNVLKLPDTSERKDHLVANRRLWLEHARGRAATQERWPNEWHDIEYQGAVAKAPPSPQRTLNTPFLQKSSSSAREEEGRWLLMEDRRRQSVAFENVAKEMLKYLENSEDLKVGITELQEHLEVPAQIGITLQQVAQQARNKRNQKVFEIFWQEEEEL